MRVVMLGTGTPNPDPLRSGPAVAVIASGQAFLVDAGAGLVRRAAAAAQEHSIPELRADKLSIAFITHLHSDHTIGLPDLIHTSWVAERKEPFRLYGPAGIDSMASHLTEAWKKDIRVRTEGDQPSTPDGWRIQATTVADGVIYEDSAVTVRAFSVPHTNWDQAFGYRFESGGMSIVISGDSRSDSTIARVCDGCDILIHEVYSAERFRGIAASWQRYHAGSHTSTTELAAIAERARPKLLVLYHQLYWGATDRDLIREMRDAGYRGRIVSAKDLEIYP